MCLPVRPCVCAHLCVHPRVETLTERTCASLCLCRFVPTLCASLQSSAFITPFFFSFLFFFSCESTNFHLCLFFFPPGEFTSASQRKCICEEVEGEGGGGWMDGEAEGAKAAETGKGTEQGGEGRREGGGRLITVAGLVAWRRRGPGMPGC